MTMLVAMFTERMLTFSWSEIWRFRSLECSRFYIRKWSKIDLLLFFFLANNIVDTLNRREWIHQEDLTTNSRKTFMNALKEFHGTILILLIKDAFSITKDTRIDKSNRVEFIPKRFEFGEIKRNRHAFLFEGRN